MSRPSRKPRGSSVARQPRAAQEARHERAQRQHHTEHQQRRRTAIPGRVPVTASDHLVAGAGRKPDPDGRDGDQDGQGACQRRLRLGGHEQRGEAAHGQQPGDEVEAGCRTALQREHAASGRTRGGGWGRGRVAGSGMAPTHAGGGASSSVPIGPGGTPTGTLRMDHSCASKGDDGAAAPGSGPVGVRSSAGVKAPGSRPSPVRSCPDRAACPGRPPAWAWSGPQGRAGGRRGCRPPPRPPGARSPCRTRRTATSRAPRGASSWGRRAAGDCHRHHQPAGALIAVHADHVQARKADEQVTARAVGRQGCVAARSTARRRLGHVEAFRSEAWSQPTLEGLDPQPPQPLTASRSHPPQVRGAALAQEWRQIVRAVASPVSPVGVTMPRIGAWADKGQGRNPSGRDRTVQQSGKVDCLQQLAAQQYEHRQIALDIRALA